MIKKGLEESKNRSSAIKCLPGGEPCVGGLSSKTWFKGNYNAIDTVIEVRLEIIYVFSRNNCYNLRVMLR